MRIAIIGNGDYVPAQSFLRQYNWIVAADGGHNHCTTMGITPNVWLGDGDSSNQNQTGTGQFNWQTDQTTTDLQKALSAADQYAAQNVDHQTYTVDLFSVTSADRLDHTLFALQTLASHEQISAIYTPHQLIRCIRACYQWSNAKQRTISLLPVATCAIIELHGFAWSGPEITLDANRPGISNIIIAADANLTINHGAVYSFEPITWT